MNDQISSDPTARAEAKSMERDLAAGREPVTCSYDPKAVAREEFTRWLHPMHAATVSFDEAWEALLRPGTNEEMVVAGAVTEPAFRQFIKSHVLLQNALKFAELGADHQRRANVYKSAFFVELEERFPEIKTCAVAQLNPAFGTVSVSVRKGGPCPQHAPMIAIDLNGLTRGK